MQNRLFTLFLVVAVGVLVGVAVVKKQVREPLLREILKKQQFLLQTQMRIEKKIDAQEGIAITGDPQAASKLAILESRIAVLETQIKNLQNVAQQPGGARQAPPAEDPDKVYTIPVEHSKVRGNKKAPVTIVEFVDFQCPFCARFHPPILEVLEAYPKKVRYVLKNFPLPFHNQAKPAAKAAFAAGEQGKYWEMAEALLENGKSLNEEMFKKLAGDIGLNVDQFMKDYEDKDGKYEGYIQKDLDLTQQVGARGTPTFYINGRKTRARDFNTLKTEIDKILSEK